MNVSIESSPLLLVAVEDDRPAKTEPHRCFGVLAIAFAVASTVHKRLGALDHQTLDEALVFVTLGCAKRWIEIADIEGLQSLIREDRVAICGHVAEILAAPHACCHVHVKIVHHGEEKL